MAIYRGIGGAGDSTTDATVTAVTQQAVNAAASATSAASSASTATTKAAAASASASSASTSATNAASSASAASTSETNALASEVAAAASEVAAGASETAAAASESAAATSESNAASSASSASSSASAASSSATAAQDAQTAAEAAQVAAELALDSFDDVYLGAKASEPTLDNDGDALVEGALYYDTVIGSLRIFKGSAWFSLTDSGSGLLLASANLSDLANTATARTNLGLGTAATTASTDYATAAQGALADTAVQPADITGWASQTYVNTAVANLVDSAPAALDTLNELAAALGDDANFSTTVTTAIGTKWTQDNTKISNWDTAYGWGDHGAEGYATYPTQTGNGGKYLTTDGSATSWATVDALPAQTGNSGKYLTTDGSTASWELIVALPDQTGNAGKFLTTDGTNASWTTTIDGGTF
jgi:hypothetical protein